MAWNKPGNGNSGNKDPWGGRGGEANKDPLTWMRSFVTSRTSSAGCLAVARVVALACAWGVWGALGLARSSAS